ncbi:S8/S53 family peptidase [Microbispora hainanensis]|uniref:S8/S53 family peptidase n=1 Tax=Microbispora hainanensis TaxID=568844 RepID=A0ABZ1SN65_9ACTN|nr:MULTISPECIES: S8 family serine peptidase [Microbispora]NJP28351.1 S8 family serine peptidase [Microbispora sp. CL1-1]
MLRPALLCAAITAVLLGTGPAAAAAPGDEDARWALDAVNAAAAWKVSKGAGVTVALLGGGQPDASLPGLSGRIELGPDLTGAAIGDDTVPPGDDATALASAIAGSGRGGGTPGIAPEARVLSVPVARSPSGGPGPAEPQDSPIARGIRYATGRGVKVICLPVPAYAVDRVERDAISFALSRGVVVVAAVGDAGRSPYARENGTSYWAFPAGYPGVVGVAAADRKGAKTAGSSDNLSVLVAAPGDRVPVTLAGGRRGAVSGTGVASALVAGAIALIKAKYPNLPPELVSRALTATSRPRPSAGYDDKVGFGVIDAAAALRKAAELTEYGRTSSMRDDSVQDDAHFGRGPVAEGPARPGPDPVRLWIYGIAVALGIGGFCTAAVALRRR